MYFLTLKFNNVNLTLTLFFFRHNAVVYFIDCGITVNINKSYIKGALGNQTIRLACFIVIFALLKWSGTGLAIFPRHAVLCGTFLN